MYNSINKCLTKKFTKMRRIILFLGLLIANSAILTAQQGPHTVDFTVNEIVQYYNGELTFCDFDSITGVIVSKNSNYESVPFWIDQNDNVIHANSVVITEENDGKLVYIEKDNDLLISVNINIIENEMPASTTHGIWLEEGEVQVLRPTEHHMGYLYVWTSSIWPLDSICECYELEINEAGTYTCLMCDQCLHCSTVTFTVNQSPKIRFIDTNLGTNTNSVHWDYYENSFYDTICIFRNGEFAANWRFDWEMWIDPVANNSNGPIQYTISAIKNGEILTGPSKWKSGIALQITNIDDESLNLSFSGPTDEDGTPIEDIIQFYQLYSVESSGWGLIRSMIPVGTNELQEIENDYDTLVIAGVLFDGHELYSNMIFPHAGTTKCKENIETTEKVQVFPNPVTNGILCLSTENANYRIFNLSGQQVKSGSCSNRIDISDLSSGIYAIEIREQHSTTTIKFIVE